MRRLEAPKARRLLEWMKDQLDCSQSELAERAGLDSRSLVRFGRGEGSPRTLERLTKATGLPPWIVFETMLPTIELVESIRRAGTERIEQCVALGLAAQISIIELLARRGREETFLTKWASATHPQDGRVLIRWLQSLGDNSRRSFGVRVGLSHETLRLLESGKLPLDKRYLPALGEGAGTPLWLIEGVMLPAITVVRLVAELGGRELLAGWEAALKAVSERIAECTCDTFEELLGATEMTCKPSLADRVAAEKLWQLLKDCNALERLRLVKACSMYHCWALVERLCQESRNVASDSAKSASRLASLALRAGSLVRGEDLFCCQVKGFAYVHLANAWRVAGRIRWAEKAFALGQRLWEAGVGTKYDFLPAWRLRDLEGSLLRDQRRLTEALEALEMARQVAPGEAWAHILINRAATLSQMVEPEAAISTLWEAEPLIDSEKEPRQPFLWSFLMAVNLCHLGEYAEAEDMYWQAQGLAEQGKALDQVRLDWLKGRIEAGIGHREEALSLFEKVQAVFKEGAMAYDYALVSLEAGTVLLEQGCFAEVQVLAKELEWTFKDEGIHKEAAEALELFRRAAMAETASANLARRVVRFLYKAQYNSELKFAA